MLKERSSASLPGTRPPRRLWEEIKSGASDYRRRRRERLPAVAAVTAVATISAAPAATAMSTASATATAASAAIPAAPTATAAAAAFRLRPGLIHYQVAPAKILAVQGIHRAVCVFVAVHFHEREASRLSRKTVTDEIDA